MQPDLSATDYPAKSVFPKFAPRTSTHFFVLSELESILDVYEGDNTSDLGHAAGRTLRASATGSGPTAPRSPTAFHPTRLGAVTIILHPICIVMTVIGASGNGQGAAIYPVGGYSTG